MSRVNEYGQPIGPVVANWVSCPRPPRSPIEGRYCGIEPLGVHHASELHSANAAAPDHRQWTYLFNEPIASEAQYGAWVATVVQTDDPLFYAIIDRDTGKAAGVAAYLRIAPEVGTIEVGHINFSVSLQRSRAATESMYLLMRRAFDLGYRRYEWKCDALNAPSRRAAERLGLSFEGIFRQAIVYKGRNRDTAWYAVIDRDWPALQQAFERWLDPGNFDSAGRQRVALSELTRPLLAAVRG